MLFHFFSFLKIQWQPERIRNRAWLPEEEEFIEYQKHSVGFFSSLGMHKV